MTFAVRAVGDAGTMLFARDALLGARRTGPRSWLLRSGGVERTFVPYTGIGERSYSAYVKAPV